LSGRQQKIAAATVGKKPHLYPWGEWIVVVFAAAVCALAHTSRSMMLGFVRIVGLSDQYMS
jgi:hypothetical protein